MSEKGGCKACARPVLAIFTFAHLAAGLAVIGLTLWIRLDESFEDGMRQNLMRVDNGNTQMNQIKENIRFGITVSFWVLCGCGLAAAIIGLFGTCGAVCCSRTLVIIYLVTGVLLILIEIAVGVFIYFYRPTYGCCGVIGEPAQCTESGKPSCSTAVWDLLQYTLQTAGFVTIGIIALQIIAVIFGTIVATDRAAPVE